MELFVLVSGTFSVLAVFPLLYLALRSVKDSRDIREIQHELAGLLRESKELGVDVHQRVSETVEQVSSAVEQINGAVRAAESAIRAREAA